MKKRIGWLRGRPIIEDIGSTNNIYKEVIRNSRDFAVDAYEPIYGSAIPEVLGAGEYTGTFYGITWTTKTSMYSKSLAHYISVVNNNKIIAQYNIANNYYLLLNNYFKKAIPDLVAAEKLAPGISNYLKGTYYLGNNIMAGYSTLKGTSTSSTNSWAHLFQDESYLEEVDIVLPKIKVLTSAFSSNVILKKFKLSAPLCENAPALLQSDQNKVCEEIDLDLPVATIISAAAELVNNGNLKSFRINAPKAIDAKYLCPKVTGTLTSITVGSDIGDGGLLTNLEVVGGGFPEVTSIYWAFCGHWWLPKLICKTPKATDIREAFSCLMCCRDLILDISQASVGLDTAISTIFNAPKGTITNNLDRYNELTNWKTVQDYLDNKWMKSFEIGAFGQADTFDNPLNLVDVFLHKDLTVTMFNNLYDRKTNNKTAVCSIKLNAETYNELSASDLAIATNKGFTIIKV